jgi:light-regulated signal transduction histidine kinase (bacteriophytochrome)
LVICEFEEFSDAFYLKDADTATILPKKPVHLLGFEKATPEDFDQSITRKSKPLPALKVAREKANQEFSSLDLFNAMTQAQKQIMQCDTIQKVFEVSVGIISELSGFHRVMFYRFDSGKNGRVDAEMLNPMASTDVYKGLHFPASDIPKQARELSTEFVF